MKIVRFFILSACLGYMIGACAVTTLEPEMIVVDQNMHSDVLEISVGESIEINLPGNPTTGYEWMLMDVNEAVLELLGEPHYKSESDALGAGGIYMFELKSIATGETSVLLEYRRTFESTELPPADEFEILVKVR